MTLVATAAKGGGLGAVTLTGTPTAGQVIVATSATAADWETPSGAMTQLYSLVLGANGVFDQATIPQTYNDLYIVGKLRTASASVFNTAACLLNNDSAANYNYELLSAFAATASAAETFGANEINIGNIPGTSAGAGLFANVEILIVGYASTTWQKTVSVRTMTNAGNATTDVLATIVAGHWKSTAAVNRVKVAAAGAGNLVTGSTLRIYGIN